MISGNVTADLEAIVELSLVDSAAVRHTLGAVVNTGFSGWLTLPPSLIAALGLSWREVNRTVLVDGRTALVDVFDATIVWDGHLTRIKVHEMDAFPLVGMRLMQGFELVFPVAEGSTCTLRRLSGEAA